VKQYIYALNQSFIHPTSPSLAQHPCTQPKFHSPNLTLPCTEIFSESRARQHDSDARRSGELFSVAHCGQAGMPRPGSTPQAALQPPSRNVLAGAQHPNLTLPSPHSEIYNLLRLRLGVGATAGDLPSPPVPPVPVTLKNRYLFTSVMVLMNDRPEADCSRLQRAGRSLLNGQ
jgi:hypothetical protein